MLLVISHGFEIVSVYADEWKIYQQRTQLYNLDDWMNILMNEMWLSCQLCINWMANGNHSSNSPFFQPPHRSNELKKWKKNFVLICCRPTFSSALTVAGKYNFQTTSRAKQTPSVFDNSTNRVMDVELKHLIDVSQANILKTICFPFGQIFGN